MLLADLNACTLGYCPTNWQRSRIPHAYQDKLTTIFDGIDTTFWRPLKWRERIPRRIAGTWLPRWNRVITYVSRGFESIRGFDIFMQIAQRICERRSDVVFLCIGSDRVYYGGDMKQIQEKSFREHLFKSGSYDLSRFIFTGPIAPAELRRAFAYSDLHIYLTVPFILSWSLMDALACGCTVLVADTPPLREVIEHGKNGLMAPYFDVDHFVELALEVLDDPATYRRTLGQAGMEMIHEKYDLDVVLPKMIRLYERAIAIRGGRGALGARLPTPPKPLTEGLPESSNGLQQIRRPSVSECGSVGDRPQREGGWLSAAEVAVLRRALPKDAKIILQLGAWRGQTTRFLAEACPNATILAVDTWHGAEYREPEHPEWKAMLPDVWESFVARTREFGNRILALRKRHDDAVRELAAAGRVPDVIYFDPDYNARLARETLAAIVRSFPHVPLVGHDWLWHSIQREVSQASRQTGRRLDARGNLWFLAPAARPLHAERECYFAPSRSGNGKRVPGVEPIGEPPVRAAGGSASLRPQPPNLQQPLRVLITIPHFYRARSSRL
jgi:hypothetical protein